ncbi:MAG: DUF4349 domain-containing protein [Flavobacteriales bacterium]|nr:DUF4349 domain-containing protein [Flavobacteriales bacterium]
MKSIAYLIVLVFVFVACNKGEKSENLDVASEETAAVGSSWSSSAYNPEEAKTTMDMEETVEEVGEDGSVTYVSKNYFANAASGNENNDVATTEPDPNQQKPVEQKLNQTNDKIIKTGEIGFELNDYEREKHGFKDIFRKYGAEIFHENERTETNRISNEITVRVPNANFYPLMDALSEGKGFKRIDYKRISATDVGEEYYDLITRIKTKKEVEQRYLTILRQAKTIKEILQVEDQIRVIREEIESKEGRLKFLEDRVSKSTITVYLYQPLDSSSPISTAPTFWGNLANAFQSGWNIVTNIILFFVHIWPITVLLILTLISYKRKWFIFKR